MEAPTSRIVKQLEGIRAKPAGYRVGFSSRSHNSPNHYVSVKVHDFIGQSMRRKLLVGVQSGEAS
jgi:hypothetical protein